MSTAANIVYQLADISFWRRELPDLSIGDRLATRAAPGPLATPIERSAERLIEEGYFQDACSTLSELTPRLAAGVTRLKQLRIPPPFLFVFDEPWECFYALDPMLRAFLGPRYCMLPDFWVWHVDPQAGESGWAAHRDKGRRALHQNGFPLSLTVWVPLTEATPQNGCMYVVPANKDPVYGTEREKEWTLDPSTVRALPAKPGEYLSWNQALLHWGGGTSRFAPHPRVSMALEFQRGDIPPFREPLIRPLVNLPFEDRLQIVANQVLHYAHMFPLDPETEQLARGLLPA